jgi:apolipoprotein N-acyltransferase
MARVLNNFYSLIPRLKLLSEFYKNMLCLALGIVSACALPPLSWPVLFLIGFGGFITLLTSASTFKQCFKLSWCYALGFHLAGLYWISASLFIDIARYWWVLPFSLLALPAYLALIFAGAACAAHPLRSKPVLHALVLSAALFINELFRGSFLGGFPWNLFGYIWADTLPVIQCVSIIGIHGLTLLTLLAGAGFSFLYAPLKKSSLIMLALIYIIFSSIALWGEDRLDKTATTFHDNVNLRLVQPNILQSERKTSQQRIAALSKLIALSNEKNDHAVTHILWPETASPFFLNQNEQARDALKHLVPKGGALITGAPSRTEHDYFNSLVVMNDTGSIVGSYDKSHLVPFGEFIPLRNILKTVPVAVDVIGTADFTAGAGPKTIRAPAMPSFSTMICYEAIFSGNIVDETDRPEALVQITNDAWFGDTSGPYQHLAMARVRAIEEGLPLIRVANSGISAIIDPLGRTIESLPLNIGGIIDSRIPKALSEAPLFTRLHSFLN